MDLRIDQCVIDEYARSIFAQEVRYEFPPPHEGYRPTWESESEVAEELRERSRQEAQRKIKSVANLLLRNGYAITNPDHRWLEQTTLGATHRQYRCSRCGKTMTGEPLG